MQHRGFPDKQEIVVASPAHRSGARRGSKEVAVAGVAITSGAVHGPGLRPLTVAVLRPADPCPGRLLVHGDHGGYPLPPDEVDGPEQREYHAVAPAKKLWLE